MSRVHKVTQFILYLCIIYRKAAKDGIIGRCFGDLCQASEKNILQKNKKVCNLFCIAVSYM